MSFFKGLWPFGVKIFAPFRGNPYWLQLRAHRPWPKARRGRGILKRLEFLIATMIAEGSLLCKK
jgi:hypothetical protein